MFSPLSEKLLGIQKWLFALLFFLTPLVLWSKTSELFEFNKMLLVYGLTLTIGGVYFARGVVDKKITLTRSPLDWVLVIFLLSQVFATIFSINIHTSLFGYYSRFHGGLISTVSYITLFYLLISFLNSLKDQEKRSTVWLLIYSVLSSAIIVAVYGVLERLGIDKHLWVQDVQNRVFSTLGQPNWLSAYLAAILPLPIFLIHQTKKTGTKIALGAMAVLFFVTILFTRSRSGIATAFIILGLIGVCELWRSARQHSLRQSTFLVLLAIGLSMLAFGTPWSPSPQDLVSRSKLGGPLWPEIEPFANRLGVTSQLKPLDKTQLDEKTLEGMTLRESGVRVGGSSSMEIRRVVWKGAIELFKRRPLLGTGVETFGYSYYWTRSVEHNLLSEWDFIYNKAHNEYVNFLATTGLVGLSTYLALIVGILWVFLREIKRKNLLALPLLIGFISILITNFFGFSVVIVALYFFLFPVLVLATSEDEPKSLAIGPGWQLTKKELKHGHSPVLSSGAYVALTLISIGVLLGWYQIYKYWWSDQLYNRGRLYHSAGFVGQALTMLEKSVLLNPNEPVFHTQLAETNADIALAIYQQATEASASAQLLEQAKNQRAAYVNAAIREMDIAISQNPWHLNFWKSKAKMELTLALMEPEYFETALATLAHANELAPTDPKILYNIGLVYEQLGKLDQAKQAYQKTLELKPDYDAARNDLARITGL